MQKTMRSRRGAALGVAALLLAAGGADARAPHPGQKLPGTKTITLSGEVRGTWTQRPQAPDVGGAYDLSGNGTVSPLGPVQAAGSLHSPGMIAHGQTTGTFTLTSPKGTLTLALSGPAQPGFSAPPTSLTFTVTGGTGTYTGEHGTGTAQLTMTPQRRPATVPGRMTPHFIVAAMFALTFGSAPSTPNSPSNPAHG